MQDESAQLQRQFAKVGYLTIKPGVYRSGKPIVLTGLSDAIIIGHGVTIKAGNGQGTAPDVADTLRLVNCKNITLIGFAFDGNASARGHVVTDSSQASLSITGCTNITIDGCTFIDPVCDSVFVVGSGPYPLQSISQSSSYITLKVCTFTGPAYRQHLSIVHGRHVLVTGCKFQDQTATYTGCALDIEANPGDADGVLSDVRVTDCDFTGCIQAAMVNGTANPTGISIDHNRISGVKGVLNGAVGTSITGNTLTGMTGIAITSNAPNARILDNTLTVGSDTSIYCNPGGSNGVLIASNQITDCIPPTTAPYVVQTRFGGGHETLTNNHVKFSAPRPDVTAYLVETGTAKCVGNKAEGCK
jgi:hypothetical protein